MRRNTSPHSRHFITLCFAFAALLLLPRGAVLSQGLPGAGKTIQPARSTWQNEWLGTEIAIRALNDLGYRLKRPVTLDPPAFYQAVGQGDVDFWVNGWFPLHETYRRVFDSNAEVVGYMVKGGALQGYMIDKKTAVAYKITSLADFKRPEIAAAFSSSQNGQATLVGGPPGWACELVIEHQLDAYGLKSSVKPIKASYEAAMADTLGRYKTGKPVFFYAATPGWVVGVMKPGIDVVWLPVPFSSLPKGQEADETKTIVPHVEGCVTDPCNMGFPPNDIRVVANKAFLASNPAARKLLEILQIPLADFSEQNARMFAGESKDEDVRRHAAEWIEKNRTLYDGWIGQAKAAAAH